MRLGVRVQGGRPFRCRETFQKVQKVWRVGPQGLQRVCTRQVSGHPRCITPDIFISKCTCAHDLDKQVGETLITDDSYDKSTGVKVCMWLNVVQGNVAPHLSMHSNKTTPDSSIVSFSVLWTPLSSVGVCLSTLCKMTVTPYLSPDPQCEDSSTVRGWADWLVRAWGWLEWCGDQAATVSRCKGTHCIHLKQKNTFPLLYSLYSFQPHSLTLVFCISSNDSILLCCVT